MRDEFPVMLRLAYSLSNCDAFVDVGANVGLYASTFAKLGSLCQDFNVYAFEADPQTFVRLQANAARYNFSAHNAAIADAPGKLTLVRGAVSHVTTSIDKANAYSIPDETFEIEARTLSSFPIDGRRLMIKIDVEGQEYSVLRGAESWFDQNRVAVVYVDGFGEDRRVVDFLANYDFELRDAISQGSYTTGTFALLATK